MFRNVTEVVKKLFYINAFIFLITVLSSFVVGDLFATTFADFDYRGDMFHFWQPITYMFLHGGLLHIAFNMLALVSIGPIVESSLGARKFLIYYLICGIISAFFFFLMQSSNVPLVGASGAIYGIVVMFAYLFPNEKLYFMLIPIGIKAKYLVTALFFLEVYLGFFTTGNIAHFGHVGGALTGIFLIMLDKYLPKSFERYL